HSMRSCRKNAGGTPCVFRSPHPGAHPGGRKSSRPPGGMYGKGAEPMRVIGGSRKRMPLVTIKGMETRPTTDRIKEKLFNMLQPEIYQCRFLDLFAGSGQMGIEALSRGAREAVFVEKNPAAARCIKRNLAFTRLEETGRLYTRDVM